MPTYERAYAPDDGWGMGIKNATKVPGRLFMTIGDSLLYDSGDYSEDYSGMTIKIRGNSSAVAFDKKPFKIKLQKKADLLMRGDENKFKDNEWLLLKDEKSTLFKLIAFKVNQILGLQWTPEFKYVNLVINDEYWGLYELCESVKRNNSCRLNVADSGFIFEYDLFWWNEDLYVKSSLSDPWTLNYTFKYPQSKNMNDKQLSYFIKMIANCERSVSDEDYPQYIDVESFAAWILGHDLLGNHDGKGSNIFLTKKDTTDNSKVMMANLWDMDRIFEMEGNWDPSHNIFFFKRLFRNKNKEFVRTYKEKWNKLSSALTDDLNTFLEEFSNSDLAEAIDKSTELDNNKWNTDFQSTRYYVNQAQKWLTSRKEWLETNISKLDSGTGIIYMYDHHDTEKEAYYNLQGQRIDYPVRKGVYIHNGRKVIIDRQH